MQSGDADHDETRQSPKVTFSSTPRSIWSVPPPVQRLFDRFPLRIYPANDLPLRSPKNRGQNVLHIFTTAEGAAAGAPSFNPSCLKWQALLTFNNIPFQTVSSSNHASPSGALPFLLPAASSSSPTGLAATPDPISTSKLESWIQRQSSAKLPSTDPTLASYSALISHPIRLAYLYALYLYPATFKSIASPLYIASSSRATLVRLSLEHPLREAALAELLTTSSGPVPRIDAARLLHEADEAFGALSTLLGDNQWFNTCADSGTSTPRRAAPTSTRSDSTAANDERSTTETSADELDEGGQQRDSESGLFDDGSSDEHNSDRAAQRQPQPGMLDAAVFAYTQVILAHFADQEAASPARQLCEALQRRKNLVRHRERILRKFFTAAQGKGSV